MIAERRCASTLMSTMVKLCAIYMIMVVCHASLDEELYREEVSSLPVRCHSLSCHE